MDEVAKSWRNNRLNRKCAYCKYCRSTHYYGGSFFTCKAKDKLLSDKGIYFPRCLCRCFTLKEDM